MVSEGLLPWVVDAAEARRLGLGRGALRAPAFVPVRRGVRTIGDALTGAADVRIAAVARQLPPGAMLAGWSAARVHEVLVARDGLDVFDGSVRWEERRAVAARRSLASTGAPDDGARVVVGADPTSRLRFRRDVRVLRSVVPPDERCTRLGVCLTTPARTAFDLARLLPETAAVIGLDRLLHLGLVTCSELSALVDGRRGWVGIALAREAVGLADAGAESPQESVLRLAWRDAGLPRPLCNVVVRDQAGQFVARVDLIDPDVGLVGEYDGLWHSGSERRSDDARRQQALESLGLVVVRAASDDVRPGREMALRRRLREAHRRAAKAPRGDWHTTPLP